MRLHSTHFFSNFSENRTVARRNSITVFRLIFSTTITSFQKLYYDFYRTLYIRRERRREWVSVQSAAKGDRDGESSDRVKGVRKVGKGRRGVKWERQTFYRCLERASLVRERGARESERVGDGVQPMGGGGRLVGGSWGRSDRGNQSRFEYRHVCTWAGVLVSSVSFSLSLSLYYAP